MLVPHAFSRTVPRLRRTSAARSSLVSSRPSGVDGSKLRCIPVESALRISGLHFAAGQSHGLENFLVPECRFLIWFFCCGAALGRPVLIRVTVLFSHMKCAPSSVHRRVRDSMMHAYELLSSRNMEH